MNFASDNAVGASPRILQAIVAANEGPLPSYGGDPHTQEAIRLIGRAFGCDPAVSFVSTGTAANALALALLTPPGGAVFCHEAAHVILEECAAPEFFTSSGKLVGVHGRSGKIDPDALKATLDRFPRGVPRQAQPACLSLSQATESGTVYSLDELKVLTAVAHDAGLTVHMDGARFANALASLHCSPAAMSYEAGVDILSLGASKNGLLVGEAILVFDRARAVALPFLQKRAGHIVSKGRLMGAQMAAYLAEDHWLDLARHANSMAARLAEGLRTVAGVRLPWPSDVNEVFPILPGPIAEALRAAGAVFYPWEPASLPAGERPAPDEAFVRLICSFATTPDDVDRLLSVARQASA